MDGFNCSIKKSSFMKEWMAHTNPPKEPSTVKKLMAGRYSSLQIK